MSTDDARMETIKQKFREAMPHFRLGLKDAKAEAGPGGTAGLAVVAIPKAGNGRILATFEADEFFEDIAYLCGIGPDTEEDELEAQAQKIVDQFPGINSTEMKNG